MISIVRQTAKVEPCTGRAGPPPPPTFNCRRVAAVDNLSMLIILWHICTLNDFDVRCCLEVDIYIFSFSPQDILVSVSVVVADRPQGLNEGLLINIDVLQCMVSWLIDVIYILQKLWIIMALDKCNDFLDFNLSNR